MRDIVPLKYCFPKLDFNVKPGNVQTFKVQLAQYSEDYETSATWQTISDSLEVDVDGNINWGDLTFTNLVDNDVYVIRFTDILNRVYDFKFSTGTTIALSDSPYRDKLLMPGQVYDWYISGLNEVGLPTTDDCICFWKCDGHKGVTAPILNIENWGSMTFYRIDDINESFEPTLDDGKWYTVTDKDGYLFTGAHIDNIGTNQPVVIGLPSMKYNEDSETFKFWHAYWYNAGGGGILADDVKRVCSSAGQLVFAFLILDDSTEDVTICGWDSDTYADYGGDIRTAWKLIFTSTGKLKTINIIGNEEYSAESTQTFDKNKWYFISISISNTNPHKVYIMESMEEDFSQSYSEIDVPSVEAKLNQTSPAIITTLTDMETDEESGLVDTITWGIPFLFGDENTKNLVVCNFVLTPYISIPVSEEDERSSIIMKVMNRNLFSPRIKLSGTTSKGNWEYMLDNKFTVAITSEKLSYVVDPDIFTNVSQLSGITYNEQSIAKAELIINKKTTSTQNFIGFNFINQTNQQIINVGGIINPATYIENSFDLKFANCDNPIEALACYFFTKHGSWGGYNGGVNGHNIYFNANKNLIIECHGDNYNGTLKGVCRESDVRPYTGYGGDVSYDNNNWDQRTRKLYARVGSALVSNKYFQYGRIDITMKIPVGTWGVCPAIWLFHYIEVSETDYRYNIAPYNERNEQGSTEAGYYRVINNEIDIELPSHLTNGILPSWYDLSTAYFDKDILDNELQIGVESGTADERGLWRLNDVNNPNNKESWVKTNNIYNARYNPSYQNIKFNNWQGELNAGDGWCLPKEVNGHTITAENYYKGLDEYDPNHKEEYHSKLIHLTDNDNGYADGQFHKWSFIWLPDRVILLVDDEIIRENKGFIPFNQMKLTLAMWFPTMPVVEQNGESIGVKDTDGIHGTKDAILTNINDFAGTSIGTWAGTQADFEICHLEVSEIQYTKYNVGDTISINGKSTHIDTNPQSMGESFPESGLRMFVK